MLASWDGVNEALEFLVSKFSDRCALTDLARGLACFDDLQTRGSFHAADQRETLQGQQYGDGTCNGDAMVPSAAAVGYRSECIAVASDAGDEKGGRRAGQSEAVEV